MLRWICIRTLISIWAKNTARAVFFRSNINILLWNCDFPKPLPMVSASITWLRNREHNGGEYARRSMYARSFKIATILFFLLKFRVVAPFSTASSPRLQFRFPLALSSIFSRGTLRQFSARKNRYRFCSARHRATGRPPQNGDSSRTNGYADNSTPAILPRRRLLLR